MTTRLLLVGLLCAASIDAQPLRIFDTRTVATLGTCAASRQGRAYWVTDAASASSCATGGGSQQILCVCNGSSWGLVASGGGGGGVTDHGDLTGLADDDHAQYALLAGRSGGQTLLGGTASGQKLVLDGHSGTAGDLSVTASGGLEWMRPSAGAPWKAEHSADGLLAWTWVFQRFAFEGNNGHLYIARNGRIGWTDQQFDPTVTPDTWLMRDDVGVVRIISLLELTPISSPPTCENGRIYYDDSGMFCGCSGGTWHPMTTGAAGTCS